MLELPMYIMLGLTIGILSGFFGIGGGFILTPTLLLVGFTPVVAIATSLLYSIATSLSGVTAHFRLRNIKWKDALVIGSSGAFATQLAHPFTLLLEHYQIEDTIIPFFYLLLISYFTYTMFKSRPSSTNTENQPTYYPHKLVLIGLFAGFVSTTLGVGGGFIIVPLLVSVLVYPSYLAVGTSLMSVSMIVSVGFISYSFSTPLNYELSSYLIIGALIGGQIGAIFTKYYQDFQIRHLLGGLYVVTGISLLFKLIQIENLGLAIIFLYCIYIFVHFIITAIKYKRHGHFHEREAS
jgi:uncharacterized protein